MDAAKICKADTKLESDVYCFVQHSYTPWARQRRNSQRLLIRRRAVSNWHTRAARWAAP